MFKKILIVGCGKMGSALVDGWTKAGIENISIVDPVYSRSVACYAHKEQGFGTLNPYNLYKSVKELPSNYSPDYIIFAVKPQQADKILPQYKNIISDDTVVISIMAGKTVKSISNYLYGDRTPTPTLPPKGGGSSNESSQRDDTSCSPSLLGEGVEGGCKTPHKIIRVMPNTPALIGQGVSVGFAGDGISDEQKAFCEKLFSTVGSFYWVNDEKLMDSVTAISGSGPAYVFYFIECLIKAGIELGLSEELANQLAIGTVAGSSALAESSDESAQQLRANVTSPNGTTQAALDVLTKELEQLIKDTAKAAKKRSEELSE